MSEVNYEAWQDPEGGEWIKMEDGTVWRPAEISMDENNNIGFQIELFKGPNSKELTAEEFQALGQKASVILTDLISQEAAELQNIAEEEEAKETEEDTDVPEIELADRLSEIDILQGGTQVSPAMMPQDLSMDIAQISGILGGLTPQEKD